MPLKLLEDQLHVNRETILVDNFGRIFTKFVPHSLKISKISTGSQLVKTSRPARSVHTVYLNCIITEGESWVFQYDPETKRQSVEWTTK
jgi:hypothetical protein